MKSVQTFVIWVLALGLALPASAQNEYDWLNIGLVMPDSLRGLDAAHIAKLETKILSIIAVNGVASKVSASKINPHDDSDMAAMEIYANGIICYPRFEIYEESAVNPGMQNLVVIRCSFSLFIQSFNQGIVFSSVSRDFSGSGKTREQALNAVIRSIDTRDAKWQEFLEKARKEVFGYYDRMCKTLLEQANQLNQLNLTAQALAILWPIPKEVACYDLVKSKAVEIYKKYNNQRCNERLMMARSKIAENNFTEGLALLGKIDPSSVCAAEAQAMIARAAAEVDEKIRQDAAQVKKMYEDSMALEKARIESMRQTAAEYNFSTRDQILKAIAGSPRN